MKENIEEQFLHYLKTSRGYSPHTLVSYAEGLQLFGCYFRSIDSGLTWDTVDTDVVRGWVAQQVAGGMAPRSVRQRLSAVRSFFRYLLMEGHVERDPARGVRSPKVPKSLPVFVKENDMDRLFDAYDFGTDYIGQRNHTILLTLYHTGIRASELLALNTTSVGMGNNMLKVTGKGNKQRLVPFGPELRKCMLHYLDLREQEFGTSAGPLFLTPAAERMSYIQLYRMVTETLQAVTMLQKRSPHVLRHSFATAMLNHGASLEAIQALLGHESLATTEIYTHTTIEELRREYATAHPRNALPEPAEKGTEAAEEHRGNAERAVEV